ncbi:hypothetical protein HDU96_010551 [Phlyctochytrium bullatum]|nr:hypothetical protein HDU96_010551 [Phlyctochytrium bullatum]
MNFNVPSSTVLDPTAQYWDAVTTGDTGTLRAILSTRLVDVDTIRDELTGLQVACSINRSDIVRILLDFGADHERKDASGRLPIQLSTSPLVWQALAANMPVPGMDLFEAARRGFDVTARLILVGNNSSKKPSFNLLRARVSPYNKLSKRKRTKLEDGKTKTATPLHVAAYHGHAAVCQVLLQMGADINCRDDEQNTPLMMTRSLGVAQLLVEMGAYIEARNDKGQTALHLAVRGGHDCWDGITG